MISPALLTLWDKTFGLDGIKAKDVEIKRSGKVQPAQNNPTGGGGGGGGGSTSALQVESYQPSEAAELL